MIGCSISLAMEATATVDAATAAAKVRRKPFYRSLWGQVLIAVAIGIVVGLVSPQTGVAMQPLADSAKGAAWSRTFFSSLAASRASRIAARKAA